MVSQTLIIAAVVFLVFTIGSAVLARKMMAGGSDVTPKRARQSKGARQRDNDH